MAGRALYRSVTCNVNTFQSNAGVAAAIRKSWGKADVLKLNEAGGAAAHRVVRNLRGGDSYIGSGTVGDMNPIVWRQSVFERVASGTKTVYKGGKGDGPDRGVTWVLLRHVATGKVVLECNMHQISTAFTSNPDRQPEWNSIQNGVSDEIVRVRTKYNNPPTVISGDMNRRDNVHFSGLSETEITLPPTLGGSRYDKFFLVGSITHKSHEVFNTTSDHDAVKCNLEITAASPASSTPTPKPTTSGSGVTATPGDPQSPTANQVGHSSATPPGDLDLRRRATWNAKKKWRFFAMREDGQSDGNGTIIHPELPLADVEIEDVLTGHNGLSGKISPEYGSLIADDGRLILEEWGTTIWAEEDGKILGGGILNHSSFDRSEWSIECIGLTGYAQDLPYAGEIFFVEEDPMNIFRHIWTHIQAQPGGNVGLQVDPLLTGLQIGVELEQVEFDTQAGPVSFESGPYKLAWYQDHDMDENLANLSTDTPFDWHEVHFWEGDDLRHRLLLGYPTLGVRRNDLRFVIGENVAVVPSVERDGSDYADEVWALGAGEGSTIKRGMARRDIAKLRRVVVVSDPSQRTQSGVNAVAARQLAWRNNLDNVSEIVVRDHPHADIASISVGDEIQIQGPAGWVELDSWYRVTGRTIKPFEPDRMVLTVMRSDRIAT